MARSAGGEANRMASGRPAALSSASTGRTSLTISRPVSSSISSLPATVTSASTSSSRPYLRNASGKTTASRRPPRSSMVTTAIGSPFFVFRSRRWLTMPATVVDAAGWSSASIDRTPAWSSSLRNRSMGWPLRYRPSASFSNASCSPSVHGGTSGSRIAVPSACTASDSPNNSCCPRSRFRCRRLPCSSAPSTAARSCAERRRRPAPLPLAASSPQRPSNAPALTRLSRTRLLTSRRSTSSHRRFSDVSRPDSRRAASIDSTAPSPTFLIAPSPKRTPAGVTVNAHSLSLTSGGRTVTPRSRHSPR